MTITTTISNYHHSTRIFVWYFYGARQNRLLIHRTKKKHKQQEQNFQLETTTKKLSFLFKQKQQHKKMSYVKKRSFLPVYKSTSKITWYLSSFSKRNKLYIKKNAKQATSQMEDGGMRSKTNLNVNYTRKPFCCCFQNFNF